MLILDGGADWGLGPAPGPDLGRWWRPRRWSVGRVLQAVRVDRWQTGDVRPAWSRSPDAWEERDAWMVTQTRAALGVRHV